MKFFFHSAALLVSIALAFGSCRDGRDEVLAGNLVVELEHRAGDEALEFGKTYTIESGETPQFSKLKYYLSNFVLVRPDGSEYVVPKSDSYFLVDEDRESSKRLEFRNVPIGQYSGLRFLLGVDSLASTLSAPQRTGVLDVAGLGSDMYWSWNTGYIFIKVEGNLGQEPFLHHVGGFGGYDSPTINNIRTINVSAPDEPARVTGIGAPEFHVDVDVLEFYKTPTTINIAENYTVHFGPASGKFADNYVDMFRIDHVHNP